MYVYDPYFLFIKKGWSGLLLGFKEKERANLPFFLRLLRGPDHSSWWKKEGDSSRQEQDCDLSPLLLKGEREREREREGRQKLRKAVCLLSPNNTEMEEYEITRPGEEKKRVVFNFELLKFCFWRESWDAFQGRWSVSVFISALDNATT